MVFRGYHNDENMNLECILQLNFSLPDVIYFNNIFGLLNTKLNFKVPNILISFDLTNSLLHTFVSPLQFFFVINT